MEVKYMKIDYGLIGMRVREKRLEAHLSQERLGELSSLSTVFISNIETNTKKPSLESLLKISNALGITLDELLSGNQLFFPGDYQSDIDVLMSDCSHNEKRFIYELLHSVKQIMRKNRWSLVSSDREHPDSHE